MHEVMVRADSADEKNARAKQIGDAIAAHDAEHQKAATTKAKADTTESDEGAKDSTLSRLVAALESFGDRLDRMEKANQPAPKEKPEPDSEPVASKADEDENDERDREKKAGKLAKIQARADSVAQARGERAPPPRIGETVIGYRRRLLREFASASKEFGHLDLGSLKGAAFSAVEGRIYGDAFEAAARPVAPEGMLVERTHTDASGRVITSWHGQPKIWMSALAAPAQRLVGIRTKSD